MGIKASLVALAAVAGCDSSSEVVISASADAVIVVQDGDGPWTKLEVVDGKVRFTPTTGLFGVVWMCPPVMEGATTYRQTPYVFFDTDWANVGWDLACFAGFGAEPEYATLTGTAPTGTRIFSSNAVEGTLEVGPAGTFGVSLRVGMQDIMAYRPSTPARFLRASIDLQADTEVAFPIDTQGVVMPVQTPIVEGIVDDDLTLYADVNTENSVVYAYFEGTPPSVSVPPLDALAPTDRATIGAWSGTCTAQLPLTDEDPTLVIPRPMYGGVDRQHAQWNADPAIAWEGVTVIVGYETGIYASQSYLEASGTPEALPIIDVTTLPGWAPELGGLVDGDTVDWQLGRYRGEYDGDYDTCWLTGSFTW